GVKIVSRYPDRSPSIMGVLLLCKYSTGEPLALMDATWITAKRTGAVAALAVKTFSKRNFESIAVIGLGQTGRSFLEMFLVDPENKNKKFKLKEYKNHAELTRDWVIEKGVKNIEIC